MFNIGDAVRVGPRGLSNVSEARNLRGTVTETYGDDLYEVTFGVTVANDDGQYRLDWCANAAENEIFPVKQPKPTLADALRLKPSTRKILNHLEKHKHGISPAEALTVYGNFRLAASIYDLRQAGFNVKTDMRHDDEGRSYARYSLAA